MNANGSNPTRLTFNSANDQNPVFTADGRILFASDRDGDYEIFIMNGDGADQTQLTFNNDTDT